MFIRFPLALILASAFACSSQPSADDTVSKFAGKWTYQSGSAIVVDCPNAPQLTLDLSKVPPANEPGYFTFVASGADTAHEVDARGCTYDWAITGDVATAAQGQSCATFPDGHGGNRVVHMETGTKTTTDGASMVVDVHFTSDPPNLCAITVKGVAVKS